MAGTVWGDLLVGLHAWPVTDFKSLNEVLLRDAAKLARTWADDLLAELMKSDADGDQQLSQPEANASKRFQPGVFQAIDADHDGQLNEDELQKGIPKRLGRHAPFGKLNASARY